MNRALVGRADLARALGDRDPNTVRALASLMGWVEVDREPELPIVDVRVPGGRASESALVASALVQVPWPEQAPPATFWRVVGFRRRAARFVEASADRSRIEQYWTNRPKEPPPDPPLSRWNALGPRLRSGLVTSNRGKRPDVARIVDRLAKGRLLGDIPRLSLRRWGDRIQIVLDRSERLVPYWRDQELVVDQFCRLLPLGGVEIASGASPSDLRCRSLSDRVFRYRLPQPGARVLVLGDLGTFAIGDGGEEEGWLRWGRRLIERGCRPLALVPCAVESVRGDLRRVFSVRSWQKNRKARTADPEARRAIVEKLLRLVAPAIRLEPGLLRGIRRLLPEACDASLEAELWQHSMVASRHSTAATLVVESAVKHLLPAFEEESDELRGRVLGLIRRWRQRVAPELWFEEILRLSSESQALIPDSDVADARRGLRSLTEAVERTDDPRRVASLEYCARSSSRRSDRAWNDPLDGVYYRRIRKQTHPKEDARKAPGFDPAEEAPGPSVQKVVVVQQGGNLCFSTKESEQLGSPLAELQSTNRLIAVRRRSVEPSLEFWKSGRAPSWASGWGADEFGPWVEFQIEGKSGKDVEQRMRWVPAGSFRMGSPEDEDGRSQGEGPRHEVTLSRGFWMFDTACVQELWEVVMGGNPSRFRGARRPVETVAWDDCQEFLTNVNDRVPDLELCLPTEAQWERACRAGTETAYSFGDRFDQRMVRSLESELYETADVGTYPANAWGLFELHGNVREWCRDGLRKYDAVPITDPMGQIKEGAERVVRGGSWDLYARFSRSACRFADSSFFRYFLFGFRCARVQEGAEPSLEDRGRRAEPRPKDPEASGGAEGVCVVLNDEPRCELPSFSALEIVSDCDGLQLEQITKPPWATAIGRDRYGLWAEFSVERKTEGRVTQRMRWIPPGRFLAGSPETEEGRDENEGPRHEVVLTCGFWLADTQCTQDLWEAVMGENPSHSKGMRFPVESVSWRQCQEFFAGVAELIPGLCLSLPSEAQWEYSCRAGTTGAYWFGERIETRHARFESDGLIEVESFDSNGFGLFDMHGNVWEWCNDGRRDYSGDLVTDPLGPTSEGAERVVRGGSWNDLARYSRSACRVAASPGLRDYYFGFRCARVQEQEE